MSNFSKWFKAKTGIPEINFTKFIAGSGDVLDKELERLKEQVITAVKAAFSGLSVGGLKPTEEKIRMALYRAIGDLPLPTIAKNIFTGLVMGFDFSPYEGKLTDKMNEIRDDIIRLIQGVKL